MIVPIFLNDYVKLSQLCTCLQVAKCVSYNMLHSEAFATVMSSEIFSLSLSCHITYFCSSWLRKPYITRCILIKLC